MFLHLLSEGSYTESSYTFWVTVPPLFEWRFLAHLSEGSYPIWVKVPSPFGWQFLPSLSESSYPVWVKVLHSFGDNLQDCAGFSLREKLLSQDLVQELSPFHQFSDHVHLAAIVIYLSHTKSPHHNPQGKQNWNSSHARCAKGKYIRVNMRNYWHLSLPSVRKLWHVFILLKPLAQSHLPHDN